MPKEYKLITKRNLTFYFGKDDPIPYFDSKEWKYGICTIKTCKDKLIRLTKYVAGNNITKTDSCGINLDYDFGYLLGCMMLRSYEIDNIKNRMYIMFPCIEVRNRFMELSSIIPDSSVKKINRIIGIQNSEDELYTTRLLSKTIFDVFYDLGFFPFTSVCPSEIESTPLVFREGVVAGMFDSHMRIDIRRHVRFKDMVIKVNNKNITSDLNRIMACVDINHKCELTRYKYNNAERIRIDSSDISRRADFFNKLVNPTLIESFIEEKSKAMVECRRDLVPFNTKLHNIMKDEHNIDVAYKFQFPIGRSMALKVASQLEDKVITNPMIKFWLDLLFDPNIRFTKVKKIVLVKTKRSSINPASIPITPRM